MQLDLITCAVLNHMLIYAGTNGNPWPLRALILVEMTNNEILMTKEILNPNSKWEALEPDVIIGSFELRHSFDIRHSDFVIVQSLFTSAATEL
jgi:hypothetical protein